MLEKFVAFAWTENLGLDRCSSHGGGPRVNVTLLIRKTPLCTVLRSEPEKDQCIVLQETVCVGRCLSKAKAVVEGRCRISVISMLFRRSVHSLLYTNLA